MLDSSRLVLLAPLAISFLSSSPPHFHSNLDSVASLSAARLVLAADGIDPSILGQLLVDQLASVSVFLLSSPLASLITSLLLFNRAKIQIIFESTSKPCYHRNGRDPSLIAASPSSFLSWLALAALTHPTSTQARRLLDLSAFATYTFSSTLSLAQGPQDPSRPDRSAEHLSAGFAFMKLWLLLARRGGEVDESGIVVGTVNEFPAGGKEGEIWESCWPAWERLLRLS